MREVIQFENSILRIVSSVGISWNVLHLAVTIMLKLLVAFDLNALELTES